MTSCQEFHKQVDELVSGGLPPDEQAALREHIRVCPDCAELWQSQVELQAGLSEQPIPEPSSDFEARIRARALGQHPQATSRTHHLPVWGGAAAAMLALGIFIGMQLQSPSPSAITDQAASNSGSEPGAQALTPQQQTVRLAFNSRSEMDNVTLTLEMPANVELSPFPGRQVVSWKVNLKQGENVLALPVNVLFPGKGELVAHLDNGNTRKTFRTEITKETEPSS